MDKLNLIKQAKKEVDQGVFVSQEAVIDWLDSWGSENEIKAPKADIFPNL